MSSKKVKRVQLDGVMPLVFEEKPRVVGDGKRAFKSVTAAVRAAEAARDEARGYRVATEVLLDEVRGRLVAAEGRLRVVRRWAVWLCVLCWVAAVVALVLH